MFKGVTELKGFIIDIDSLGKKYREWEPLLGQYRCCFLSEDNAFCDELKKRFGDDRVLHIEAWEKLFAPNEAFHDRALQLIGLSTTEIAYVSKNTSFITNALGFMSGTILITDLPVEYSLASQCPDLVLDSVNTLVKRVDKNLLGFYGEKSLSPGCVNEKGSMLAINFKIDDANNRLFSLGRYFGVNHYMSQLHPYSSAIYLNKKETGKAYGVYNQQFTEMYEKAAFRIKENIGVDCICNVPTKPEKADRFKVIVEDIAKRVGVKNISESFICTRNYESQKSLNSEERAENIKGVFLYTGNLEGKKVLLIDDVISTGATARECIRALKSAGAEEVIILVLAVNQLGGTYWSNNQPIIECPNCEDKMHLLVNSQRRTFFYKCYKCGKMINYVDGKAQLIEKVNSEFVGNIEEEDVEFLS